MIIALCHNARCHCRVSCVVCVSVPSSSSSSMAESLADVENERLRTSMQKPQKPHRLFSGLFPLGQPHGPTCAPCWTIMMIMFRRATIMVVSILSSLNGPPDQLPTLSMLEACIPLGPLTSRAGTFQDFQEVSAHATGITITCMPRPPGFRREPSAGGVRARCQTDCKMVPPSDCKTSPRKHPGSVDLSGRSTQGILVWTHPQPACQAGKCSSGRAGDPRKPGLFGGAVSHCEPRNL